MNQTEIVLKNDERVMLALRGLYAKYGYAHYKVNKFEEYDLYVKNKDFLVSDRVITFTGVGGKLLALKPDVTLSIIRNTRDCPGYVQKVYYNEYVYRATAGDHEFREIMQTGLECIGDIDMYNICEVIMLAEQSLAAVSNKFVLDISHMGFITSFFDSLGIDGELRTAIVGCIGEKNTSGIDALCRENGIDKIAREKICALASTYGPINKILPELRGLAGDGNCTDALDELEAICGVLTKTGHSRKIRLDFSVVNDMSYYNGIVFRGYVEGIPSGVLSGGQYDKLVHKLGRTSGAIGFAVYLDLLERLGETVKQYDVDVLLLYDGDSDMDTMVQYVKMLTENGKTVMSQKCVPEKIKYRQLMRLRDGRIEILETAD